MSAVVAGRKTFIFSKAIQPGLFFSQCKKINCLKGKGVAEKWTVEECREELRKRPTQDFCHYVIPKAA